MEVKESESASTAESSRIEEVNVYLFRDSLLSTEGTWDPLLQRLDKDYAYFEAHSSERNDFTNLRLNEFLLTLRPPEGGVLRKTRVNENEERKVGSALSTTDRKLDVPGISERVNNGFSPEALRVASSPTAGTGALSSGTSPQRILHFLRHPTSDFIPLLLADVVVIVVHVELPPSPEAYSVLRSAATLGRKPLLVITGLETLCSVSWGPAVNRLQKLVSFMNSQGEDPFLGRNAKDDIGMPFDPRSGNVVFMSEEGGWAFTLPSIFEALGLEDVISIGWGNLDKHYGERQSNIFGFVWRALQRRVLGAPDEGNQSAFSKRFPLHAALFDGVCYHSEVPAAPLLLNFNAPRCDSKEGVENLNKATGLFPIVFRVGVHSYALGRMLSGQLLPATEYQWQPLRMGLEESRTVPQRVSFRSLGHPCHHRVWPSERAEPRRLVVVKLESARYPGVLSPCESPASGIASLPVTTLVCEIQLGEVTSGPGLVSELQQLDFTVATVGSTAMGFVTLGHKQRSMQWLSRHLGKEVPCTTVPFLVESVLRASPQVMAPAPNRHSRFWVSLTPWKAKIADEETKGEVKENPPVVWAQSSDATHSNRFVLDLVASPMASHFELAEAKQPLIRGFEYSCIEGPRIGAPLWGVEVRLHDLVLTSDSIHRGPGQIIPSIRRAVWGAQLADPDNLVILEPRVAVLVHGTSEKLEEVDTWCKAFDEAQGAVQHAHYSAVTPNWRLGKMAVSTLLKFTDRFPEVSIRSGLEETKVPVSVGTATTWYQKQQRVVVLEKLAVTIMK